MNTPHYEQMYGFVQFFLLFILYERLSSMNNIPHNVRVEPSRPWGPSRKGSRMQSGETLSELG
jgi:hypothetical protein